MSFLSLPLTPCGHGQSPRARRQALAYKAGLQRVKADVPSKAQDKEDGVYGYRRAPGNTHTLKAPFRPRRGHPTMRHPPLVHVNSHQTAMLAPHQPRLLQPFSRRFLSPQDFLARPHSNIVSRRHRPSRRHAAWVVHITACVEGAHPSHARGLKRHSQNRTGNVHGSRKDGGPCGAGPGNLSLAACQLLLHKHISKAVAELLAVVRLPG